MVILLTSFFFYSSFLSIGIIHLAEVAIAAYSEPTKTYFHWYSYLGSNVPPYKERT